MKTVKTKFLLFLILLSSTLSVICNFPHLTPKKSPRPMTTSVIVPCIARHFFWLSGMLESYQNQTILPDEIVISLCDATKVDPIYIEKLKQGNWDFQLKILCHDHVILDGDNRTIAMNNSSGEILIFSDADDIPHPQRIEIAKYFFENYEVDHIIHHWTPSRNKLNILDIYNLNPLKFSSGQQVINSSFFITTGSPCFLRKVGNAIKWTAIQDQNHARLVYERFKNNIVLPVPLILYRNSLSSHSYKDFH